MQGRRGTEVKGEQHPSCPQGSGLRGQRYSSYKGPYVFWKVMEIENAIFLDLENFGKEMVFYISYGKVLDFWLEKL